MHYTIPISQGQRKLIKSLYRKDKREEHDLFIAEGIKLCEELLDSEYDVIQVIVRESPSQKIIEIALSDFSRKILFIISGNDLTAAEFKDLVNS